MEAVKITLVLPYRTPNPRNKRQHWSANVKEKHAAQDALMSALRSAASAYSMSMPNSPQSKICSTACNTLGLWTATGRIKSRSALPKKRLTTFTKNKPS